MKNERDLRYYKKLNYKMDVFFDEEDSRWYARLPELGAVLADGATPDEAVTKVLSLKDEVIESDFKRGLPIPEPRPVVEYSGKFLLRVPKSLHQKLADEAEREGTSINRLAIQLLSVCLDQREITKTVTHSIKTIVSGAVNECIKARFATIFSAVGESFEDITLETRQSSFPGSAYYVRRHARPDLYLTEQKPSVPQESALDWPAFRISSENFPVIRGGLMKKIFDKNEEGA